MDIEAAVQALSKIAADLHVSEDTLEDEEEDACEPPLWTWREQHEYSVKLMRLARALRGCCDGDV